ncbi:MAG: prepilin-type N-terminal cleavage/methylation domain-containing protein [Colwellia sp.]|nr:prepilin-type N-terminal cleavage/methylation domain-containing protein [Colwellia sp.]
MITEYTQLKKSSSQQLNNTRGFSLIEIIVVIVILGVLATGISTFINFGTQIYTDARDREQVVSSARFAIERLNREVRTAVPNSVRVNANNLIGVSAKQCLEFTPIVLSTIYTDIAVIPEPASDEIKVIAFDESLFNAGFSPNLNVGVYILNTNELYGDSDKVFTLLNNTIIKSGNEWTLTLADAETFSDNSPTQRLFFFNQSVSYCVQNSRLTRHQNYNRNADNTPTSAGVLMAENITVHNGNTLIPPFGLTEATQLRNSMVLIKLSFTSNLESIVFNNEIQVPNVP